MSDSDSEFTNKLIKINNTKSRYSFMYVPICDIENVTKNNTYLYDYNHNTIYETFMSSDNCKFKILHYHKTCQSKPKNVTYVLYCPICSKYGQASVASSYIHTNYSNLRFYLTHSNPNCSIIRKKYYSLVANLLCDNCHLPL